MNVSIFKTQNMNDLLYLIALTQIKNVGAKHAKNLISYCGGAKEVFKATQHQLFKVPGIGEKIAANIRAFKDFDNAKKELEFIQKSNIEAFSYLDKDYSQRLKHYDDSPVVLFKKGNTNLNAARTVAIVGTRKATARGKAICEQLISDLKVYDISIISGLAYGIDVTAHKKCVELDIPTIGVLGHGLDRIYPSTHRNIAEQMLKDGALITEFPSNTKPNAPNFPARNRIIAGMSDAVIVVETRQTGGSMITAHIANDYNKDVFAIPGRLGDESSKGCNHLIKTHKAFLLESAEDIAYIMRWEKSDSNSKTTEKKLYVGLSDEERKIVELIRTHENINTDKLTYELEYSTSKLAALMLSMEFRGILKSLPGNRYTLL